MAIASQWEQKLFQEMTRLTNELNQINGEERQDAVEKIKREYTDELFNMKENYTRVQNQLREEVQSLRMSLASKSRQLEEVQQIADNQVIQTRMYLEHRENDHQIAMDKASDEREKALGKSFGFVPMRWFYEWKMFMKTFVYYFRGTERGS